MALVVVDRVQETTATTGTGTYNLAGAKSGFASFSGVGDGNTTYYACSDGTDFEVGLGTYQASGSTLARTTILSSSNSNNAVNWGAGDKDIFVTLPSEKAVLEDALNNVTTGGTVNGRNLTTDGTKLDGIAASANAYVHPNHSGEVTSTADGATVVASNVVDEDNLKVSNTPTDGYFLSAQSGNTGGLTWASPPAGYADSDVDIHLNQANAQNGKYLGWNGSDYIWETVHPSNSNAQFYNLTANNTLDVSSTANFASTVNFNGNLTYFDGNLINAVDATLTAKNLKAENTSTTGLIAHFHNSTGKGIDIKTEQSGNLAVIEYTGNSDLIFKCGFNERFRFRSNGSFSLGGGGNEGSAGQVVMSNGSNSAAYWGTVYGPNSHVTFASIYANQQIYCYSNITSTATVYCQALNISGSTYYGGLFYPSTNSDDRLKVKSNNIPEALSKISQLDGFFYTDSDAVTDRIRGTNPDGTVNYIEKETTQKVGVSAQSLEKVLPEAVGKTLTEQSATETQYLTVDYPLIVPLLVEGIKELKTKVETLETENTAIKARLDALEA